MINLDNYTAVEVRVVGALDGEAKLDGRFLKGFKNDAVTDNLVNEIMENSTIYITTLAEKTTLVRCTLPNGFEIIETSTCIHPSNYDEAIGAEICLEKIRDKVWMLLGFLYQSALAGFNPNTDKLDDMIDEAFSLALDEILEEELGKDVDALVNTRFYQSQKKKFFEAIEGETREALKEAMIEEELSLDDMVELIVAMYLASKN